MKLTYQMRVAAKKAWHDAAMKKSDFVKILEPDEIIEAIAPHVQENPNDLYEKSLRSIASLWPDPGMCAELVPEWIGPNDGRMRADTLWYALNEARKALGLPTYPKPKHWENDTADVLEKL